MDEGLVNAYVYMLCLGCDDLNKAIIIPFEFIHNFKHEVCQRFGGLFAIEVVYYKSSKQLVAP